MFCRFSIVFQETSLYYDFRDTPSTQSPLNVHYNVPYYRLQTKLRKGYVFTPVCHSVHKGVSAPVHAGIHNGPGRHPPGQTPRADTPPDRHHPRRRLLLRTVRILLECISYFKSDLWTARFTSQHVKLLSDVFLGEQNSRFDDIVLAQVNSDISFSIYKQHIIY